ncbi:DUF2268 domain-containing protein [Paenibacillus sp. FJAT-26967]|uniref:DUF2268 domain-containing protein n=1 Tax=Paenibacillus sp. FJAT-26967 TaxID=1729690 RepID=UPI0009FC8A58|nr:DUF2268 domain-containing protein [Paenibacillus sp. FJAT-26967]
MNVKLIVENTLEQYEKLFTMPERQRTDYFRYTMMKPFEPMWNLMNIPLKAKQPGGYDVLMACQMLGFLDVDKTADGLRSLQELQNRHITQVVLKTLHTCVEVMHKHDLLIAAKELRFGLYLADEQKLELQKGYCGFGGIPGFIQVTIHPNAYNVPRIPAVIAHEFHHNIRFSYMDWDYGNVTVGDYLVIEGLAESFARELYGDDLLGPWVSSMSEADVGRSMELIGKALDVKGFGEVSSYMFGDEIAISQGYQPAGLAPFAGYTVGYRTVQSFMKEQGCTIYDATRCSTEEILKGSRLF